MFRPLLYAQNSDICPHIENRVASASALDSSFNAHPRHAQVYLRADDPCVVYTKLS
jgi:hypothetical protein